MKTKYKNVNKKLGGIFFLNVAIVKLNAVKRKVSFNRDGNIYVLGHSTIILLRLYHGWYILNNAA